MAVRPQGINALMSAASEGAATYGQVPATGFFRLPFVSHALGEEQPLIEDDQLGFGREGLDPVYDVITNDGDLVVPVDLRGFGFWLRQTFGAPTTTATGGKFSHVFKSGTASLPSTSIEISQPEGPSHSVHYGAVVNTLNIPMQRTGMLNATLAMIAQGETDASAVSVAGTPTVLRGPRFAQATGSIKVDGEVAGDIVSAGITYSNQLDKVEVIREDGRIGGVDPGKVMSNGQLVVRGARGPLASKGRGKVPAEISFGWTQTDGSLIFALPRIFLPRVKQPIAGPKGLQSTFNWQGSGAETSQLTVTLVNDVASYA
jgi:hypothetical protein